VTLDPKVARAIVRKRQRGAREVEEANELIRKAIADGATLRELGDAIGLSDATVHYIVNGRKR
jgi:hypothetical protein